MERLQTKRFYANARNFLKISAALILFAFAFAVHAASFTAALDRDTVTLGESATLSLSFEGAQPRNVPAPSVSGLQIVQAGTSQNMSWINGAMSSTVTVSFSVTPQRAGEFEIPAMTVELGGQQYSSQPLKLVVQQASAPSAATMQSGSQLAFLKLLMPRDKFYVGETFQAQLQIYLRDDVQNFGDFRFVSTPADGVTLGKMMEGQKTRAQVGNRIYTIVPIVFPVTVSKAGADSMGPFSASVVVVIPGQGQNGDPFMQFFNRGEQKQLTLATEQLSLQSQPLPTENVPATFSGAIGDYTMTVSAGPTNVTAGDPITVRVQVAGGGTLDSVALPNQTGWDDFKVFSPTAKTDYSDQLGLQGTKTFEEIVTPQNANVHELPPFTFSFFNPRDGRYHTLTQPATPLIVRAAAATPMPALAAKNAPAENQSPRDILPNKEDIGSVVKVSAGRDSVEPFVTKPAFVAVQAIPVLAFIGALVWRKRADNLANNPRLRRRLQVDKMIETGLVDLKNLAGENKPEEFFALLFRLLQEQLGERLDCPASAITENVIDEHPLLRGASRQTQDGLRELFQLCNQARYAPVRGSSELNSVATQFQKVIGEVREVKS